MLSTLKVINSINEEIPLFLQIKLNINLINYFKEIVNDQEEATKILLESVNLVMKSNINFTFLSLEQLFYLSFTLTFENNDNMQKLGLKCFKILED